MAIYSNFNRNLNRPRPAARPVAHVPGAWNAGGSGTPGGTPGGFVDETPKPPDYASIYNTASAEAGNVANKNYTGQIGQISQGENRLGNDYGYTLSRDDNGYVTGSSIDWENIDTTNPFSKAALLKRAYGQQQAGTTNSYAARGQLYSGAVQNARNQDLFGYQQNQDALTKAFNDSLAGYSQRRADAASDRDTTIQGAGLEALRAALKL